MGICQSCCNCDEDDNLQQNEVNERTHLLIDPVSNNTVIQRVHSDDFLNRYPNSIPKRTDEQSALNKILQETATNVIDVAALDSHTLEQHEFQDRVTHYTHRLNGLAISQRWKPPAKHNSCLLLDVPGPEKILASDPNISSNLTLMNSVMDKVRNAKSDLKVDHREDLVVPFRIP